MGRPKSLVLCSNTRFGKTEWARSLCQPHAYFAGYFNLSEFDHQNSRYAIFDDIPMDSKPLWKSFMGCQLTFTLTDKYRKKVNIPNWGKTSIFLCNDDTDPLSFGSKLDSNFCLWLHANCIYIRLDTPLFE